MSFRAASRAAFAALAIAIAFGSATTSTQSGVDVLTYHNDSARTGQNLNETILTPSSVNAGGFGKLAFFSADGKVDAQPLFVSALSVPNQGVRNVLFVATEHDSVYAFDADSGTVLWRVSVLGSGETPSDARSCGQVTPEIGITATPVIDRSRGPNGAIYVVAMSKNSSGAYFQRLHALDLATGAELFGGPRAIQAAVAGSGAEGASGIVVFDPKQHEDRAALLLVNGAIVTSWSSHCDIAPYTSWVISYDAGTLAQRAVLNLTPNGMDGGIWMAGGGPAADASNNVYLMTGNGTFDTTLDANGFPIARDFGNAFVKMAASTGLSVSDYFTPFDTVAQTGSDLDLGSGGVMLLPDVTDSTGVVRHLAVGTGKDRRLYVYNRDSVGKFSSSRNNVYQEIDGVLAGGMFAVPAYYNGRVYFGAVGDTIKAFQVTNARLATTPTTQTSRVFAYPGTTPSISANGATNGIVWAVQNSNPAVLYAFDARDLGVELYNSTQAANGRDQFGAGNKFIAPMIANGKVYVGTQSGVAVFGLLAAAPGAPSNLRASSSGSSITLSWAAPASGGAPTSYVIEAGSRSGASDLGTQSTGSTATTFTSSSIPNGTYYVRVRAQNAVGTSAPSNEALLAVGVPGPPSNFAAVVSGTAITMSWSAPAIGGAPTTYVI